MCVDRKLSPTIIWESKGSVAATMEAGRNDRVMLSKKAVKPPFVLLPLFSE